MAQQTTRVAIVTGGNKGIGLAIVRSLCKKFNGDVVLTARDESRGQSAVKQLQGEGLNPKFCQLDIDSRASITNVKEFLKANYGGVDVLMNNAAIGYEQPANMSLAEHAKNTIATNFTGTLNMTKTLLPLFKPHSRIVIVSTMYGRLKILQPHLQEQFSSASLTEDQLVALMDQYVQDVAAGDHISKGWAPSAYGVSKVGVNALTKILARELSKDEEKDILVNTCCPGWVRTDMGGPNARLSPDQGAETPVYLALLPPGSPSGKFWSRQRQITY